MDLRLVGVALLALTAGCGTIVGPDRTADTFTPAPVPETTPAGGDADGVAPGVGTDGVSDVNRLANAHEDAIEGTAYVWHHDESSETTRENLTVPITRSQELRVENERRYRYHTDSRSFDSKGRPRFFGNFSEFSDGETRYQRYTSREVGRSWEYKRTDAVDVTFRYGGEATAAIRQFLDVESATVVRAETDDERLFRVAGTTESVSGFGEVRDYEVRALVSETGFVRSLTVTFFAPDRHRRYSYEFSYTRIGIATVEPPDWIADGWTADAANRSA